MMIDVIIPVYRPDKSFDNLISMLLKQTIRPNHIFLIYTKEEADSSDCFRKRVQSVINRNPVKGEGKIDIRIKEINKEDFDHGGTRHMAAMMSEADYLIYLTQDARPKDNTLIEMLIEPFSDPEVGVVYARQLAKEDASDIEIYTRIFNYPEVSHKKTREGMNKLGIKTYFCSNVCAAYRRGIYLEAGGFYKAMIFNEDMLFAAEIIKNGYAVYYNAKAKVYHSHNYSWTEQLKRNFDLGVSQKQHSEVFDSVPSEGEGMRLVKQTFEFFIDRKDYVQAIKFLIQSCFKYTGYFLGKHYHLLPRDLILLCTMNRNYWYHKEAINNNLQN